jgi:hypothetical protein
MTFALIVRGVNITQAQADAIIPVINESMSGKRMGNKTFESRCIAAMESAGHPLIEEPKHVKTGVCGCQGCK